jgi:hypothetical protein
MIPSTISCTSQFSFGTPLKSRRTSFISEANLHYRSDDAMFHCCSCIYRSCKDIVSRLLDKRETTRLGSKSGASEVKQHKWFAKINWGLLRHTQPPVSTVFSILASLLQIL